MGPQQFVNLSQGADGTIIFQWSYEDVIRMRMRMMAKAWKFGGLPKQLPRLQSVSIIDLFRSFARIWALQRKR